MKYARINQFLNGLFKLMAITLAGVFSLSVHAVQVVGNEDHAQFQVTITETGDQASLEAQSGKPGIEPHLGARSPDRAGLLRDTGYYFLYQIVFVGVLYVMPQDISGWTEEQKDKDRIKAYKENVSKVTWDTDDFAINYIGHPYFGAAYYIRARERGYNTTDSFWYSALLSASFEFGTEAFFENPSIQDLIVTPVLGTAVGQYFERVRTNIKQLERQSGKLSTGDKWILALTDPLGFLNQSMQVLFQNKVRANVVPYMNFDTLTSGINITQGVSQVGLHMTLQW